MTVKRALEGTALAQFLTSGEWPIVHLVCYVEPTRGDLIFSPVDASRTPVAVPADAARLSADALAELCERAKVELLVLATCESAMYVQRLSRSTRVVASPTQVIWVGSRRVGAALLQTARRRRVPQSGLLYSAKRHQNSASAIDREEGSARAHVTDVAQLKKLRAGVTVWNDWRVEHPFTRINLRGADLTGMNLASINLEEADLSDAKLADANLEQARLVNADFSAANLEGTRLTGTDLTHACFRRANLDSADLRGIFNYFNRIDDSGGANFEAATLREANLLHTDLSESNFTDADLSQARLFKADLRQTTFVRAKLNQARANEANFTAANLELADLADADVVGSVFRQANLRKANLARACLIEALFEEADLTGADLRGANLKRSIMVGTILDETQCDGALVHGISVWDISCIRASQRDLVITGPREPTITVDDLEVAQFVYLLLKREKLRNVIDTITSKAY